MAEQNLPQYQRSTQIEGGESTPDFSDAMEQQGKQKTALLSAIGAQVAQTANTKMMQNLGYAAGKTPTGDIGIPITDADKAFQQGYNTQAKATLTLHANQMMLDAQNEVNKANVLTPDLIANTHIQLQKGIDSILQNAPSEIKPELQDSFNSQLQMQTFNLQNKMIEQQKDDQKNITIAGIDTNTKNAFNAAAAGDFVSADHFVSQAHSLADQGVANRFITPEQSQVSKDSASDAARNGKFITLAQNAQSQGKLAEWEKGFADSTPESMGMTPLQKQTTAQAVMAHMSQMQSMKTQYEDMRVANFQDAVINHVGEITGSMLQDLKENVSPAKYVSAESFYYRQRNAAAREQQNILPVLQGFSDPTVMSTVPAQLKNRVFDQKVSYLQQYGQQNGNPISQDDAEVQVAASAGSVIPKFVNSLNDKLVSGNPAYMQSAVSQMDQLYDSHTAHALVGLSDSAKAIYTQFKALSGSYPPDQAARFAVDNVLNQSGSSMTLNNEKWNNILSLKNTAKMSHDNFGLSLVDKNPDNFINPSAAKMFGGDIYENMHSNYLLNNGDYESAQKMTKQYFSENYGDTRVNGGINTTYHPVEDALGYKNNPEVVPIIHQDIANQLQAHFNESNKQVQNLSTINGNGTWNVVSVGERENKAFGWMRHETFKPLQVSNTVQTAEGPKVTKYDVVISGDSSSNYSVNINTPNGMIPLFQVAPYLGVITYKPNKKFIDDNYNRLHTGS